MRVRAEVEVATSQRDNFPVGRMVAGLGVQFTRLVRLQAFPEVLQQQGLLGPRSHDQDSLAVFQRRIDPRKECRIVMGFAGTDGIGLVMQMSGLQFGMNRPLIDGFQTQIKYLGDPMIDPDDGVIVNSHDFSFFM